MKEILRFVLKPGLDEAPNQHSLSLIKGPGNFIFATVAKAQIDCAKQHHLHCFKRCRVRSRLQCFLCAFFQKFGMNIPQFRDRFSRG